jgi:hypothetical protein
MVSGSALYYVNLIVVILRNCPLPEACYSYAHNIIPVDSKGVGRWCITLGLLGFWTLSIVLYCKKHKRTMFRQIDLFPCSGETVGDTITVSVIEISSF